MINLCIKDRVNRYRYILHTHIHTHTPTLAWKSRSVRCAGKKCCILCGAAENLFPGKLPLLFPCDRTETATNRTNTHSHTHTKLLVSWHARTCFLSNPFYDFLCSTNKIKLPTKKNSLELEPNLTLFQQTFRFEICFLSLWKIVS